MKRLLILTASVMVLSSMAACSSTEPANPASTVQQSEPQKTPGSPVSGTPASPAKVNASIDPSIYAQPERIPDFFENTKDKLTLKQGNITFTAVQTEATAEEQPESPTVVGSMTVEIGAKKHTIKLDKRPSRILSADLSADQKYLTIYAGYNFGSRLVLFDLEKGSYITLNEELRKNGQGEIETIPDYDWSQEGHQLALSYGVIGANKLAQYDPQAGAFTKISDSSYISVPVVLWNRDGKSMDYVAEQPSDQYKLYRYNLEDKSSSEVTPLTREELNELVGLAPSNLFITIRANSKP